MKKFLPLLIALTAAAHAATVNWSASIDNGLSLANGTNVAAGSLVRLGYFASGGVQLTDAQIQALASSPSTLNSSFVEVGTTTIGSGVGSVAGHFSASSSADADTLGVAGKQIYVWVFNASTLAGATQHGIFYWLNTNTATNPDSTPETPGSRWSFPSQSPVPGVTTIDLTDLTTGTTPLAAGARVVVGTFSSGISSTTSAPNFGLAIIATELDITSTSPLGGGVVGASYSTTLAAAGGTSPYTWSVSSGTVPTGTTLSSAGVLSGTPTTAGSFTFTAQVADSASATATKTFTVVIAATALSITSTSPLTSGTIGTSYSVTLAATGGTTAYTWSVSAGTMPTGLSLSSAGVLSGTPTAAGTFNFTVQVADSGGLTATKTFALTIAYPALSITTASPLADGATGTSYSQTIAASGGTSSYTWALTSGSLPTGITFSTAGVLSGTPTATGTFSFTLQVTDTASTTASKTFALTVTASPVTITTATPLTSGVISTAYSQTFAASGGTGSYTWSLATGALPTGLSLSSAGVLSGTPGTNGTYAFTVQATDTASVSGTKTFSLTIDAFGPLDHFTWDYVPATANANAPFAVHLTARDASERLVATDASTVNLTAQSGSGTLASPIVITEYTDEGEDQFEIQNISNATVNTTGWFVRIGDTQTNTVAGMNTLNATAFNLPASMTAGQCIRVTETSANANGTSILYFGSSISWSAIPGNGRGWVMLLDSTSTVKDFFAAGWDATTLASFSVTINGSAKTLTGQWSGAGGVVGTRGPNADMPGITLDSFQRTGTSDNHTSADWVWLTNGTAGTSAMSFGSTNTGLTVPWSSSTPLTISPTTATLANGEFLGYLTITTTASDVTITANDGASHTGTSASFTVAVALVDSDSDGIDDAYETAHGLTIGTNDASGDPDGDGTNNLAEYKAGTDPQSASAAFKTSSFSIPASGQFSVSWPGVAGKLYRVRTSPDLATWTTLTTLLPTTGGTQSVTMDTGGATQLFVRVEIVP